MSLPTGWSIQVLGVRAQLDGQGTTRAIHGDYALLDASGNQVGGGTHSIPANAPGTLAQFSGDGTTIAFTTAGVPGRRVQQVRVGGTVQATGWTAAQNADKTWTVTFATAPVAAPKDANNTPIPNVAVVVQTGPGLDDPACDLAGSLGLGSASGTVYQGGAHASAHQHVADVHALLAAYMQARIQADKFS